MKNNKILIIIVVCIIIGTVFYILNSNAKLSEYNENNKNILGNIHYNIINNMEVENKVTNIISDELSKIEMKEENNKLVNENVVEETNENVETTNDKEERVEKNLEQENNYYLSVEEKNVNLEKNNEVNNADDNKKVNEVIEESNIQINKKEQIEDISVEITKENEEYKEIENENKSEDNVIVEEKKKSIYDYAFDIQAIKKELISLGEMMGLVHIMQDDGITRTPENSSWTVPVTGSVNFQGERLEKSLKDMVKSMPELVKAYGGTQIEYFTIYVEEDNGRYAFYFLY